MLKGLGDDMVEKVTAGAKISCSLGSAQTMLQMPVKSGSTLKGRNQVTANATQVGVNIIPFGTCAKSSPPVPCTPSFATPWLMTDPRVQINGQDVVNTGCILPCMCGGIIKFEDSGQK